MMDPLDGTDKIGASAPRLLVCDRLAAVEIEHVVRDLGDLIPQVGGSIRGHEVVELCGLLDASLVAEPKQMRLDSLAAKQMRERNDTLRSRDDDAVLDREVAKASREDRGDEDGMIGMSGELVFAQLGGEAVLPALVILAVVDDGPAERPVVDDPMDDVRTGYAFGDTRDVVTGELSRQRLEHVDLAFV